MKDHPQLLDITKTSIFKTANPVPINALFDKYKADELKGYAREKYDETQQVIQKSTVKAAVFMLLMTAGWYPFLIAGIIILNMWGSEDRTFSQIYDDVPVLIWLLPIFFILAIVTTILFVRKFKQQKGFLAEITATDVAELDKIIKEQFNIYAESAKIDFIQRTCNTKGKPLRMTNQCVSLNTYRKGDFVYLEFRPYLLKIPRNTCMSVEMVQNKIRYGNMSHNMSLVDFRSPEIKAFGIKKCNDDYQMVPYLTKQYGHLLFQSGNELWALDVLPYHFEQAKKLFKD